MNGYLNGVMKQIHQVDYYYNLNISLYLYKMIYYTYRALDDTMNTYINVVTFSLYMIGAIILIAYCDKLKSKNK